MTAVKIGGYFTYDEFDGEVVRRKYLYPFVVRGKVNGEGTTIAAFATMEKAVAFVNAGAGHWGKDNVTIENWNE